MVSNDRSLTNQKDGLGHSLNLTNQDFYICLVDEKNQENNSVLAGHTVPSPSCAHFDFPPFLWPGRLYLTSSSVPLVRHRACTITFHWTLFFTISEGHIFMLQTFPAVW